MFLAIPSYADYVIRPLKVDGGWLSDAVVNSDVYLSFNLKDVNRTPTGIPVCVNAPVSGAYFYMVYWMDNITVAGKKVIVKSVPTRFSEVLEHTVVASKIEGNNITVVGVRNYQDPNASGACIPAGPGVINVGSGDMRLSSVLEPGNNKINFKFRMLRILADRNMSSANVLALAEQYKGHSIPQDINGNIYVHSYCVNINNNPVNLEYGTMNANEVHNKKVSKSITFQCNSQSAMPKITLSRNNIPVCDGVSIELIANSNRGSGKDITTNFESTLKASGGVKSSCAGTFSESVIATITPS